ncbi:proline/serine-rich protein [Lyophyllum atratum]|nr:proline/serine-rich protein [Lyophyllum atratum]
MATPASSQRPPSAPGPSATWSRSGEPGSAFNGLSRGRGRGNGRGRGGRGGGRGNGRESKPIGADSSGDKANSSTSKNTSTPSSKLVTLPPPTNDKPPASPSVSSSSRKAGGNSRRTSRTIPPMAVPQLNVVADVPNSASSSRPQNRRRRSQSSKPVSTILPKINVPSHDDNLLRPQRARMGPVPHSAPIKDAPPHLPGSAFDMRNNIDALVERVRAVAMADNRPSTPGSHIDWAGDDDDSLPDLDDWGVTPATGVTEKPDMISPIVVDGLTPLPDVNLESQMSPPPKTPDLSKAQTSDDPLESGGSTESPERAIHSLVSATDIPNMDDPLVAIPIITTQQPLISAPASAKVSLHPSLPAKPAVTADVSSILPNSRHGPGATPMRPHPNPTLVAVSDKPTPLPAPHISEQAQVRPGACSHRGKTYANKEEPLANLLPRDGLTASIHAPAPSVILESQSAPSNISSYSAAEHRTHTRAHTVGRPPSFPRADQISRPSRSGYNTPRGGLSAGGAYHSRTHSTPPAGMYGQRIPNAHRPVLTGDAISRLARTIGNTALSPGRATTVTATHD